MTHTRHTLSGRAWQQIEPVLPPCKGRPGGDRRWLLNAVLWIACNGSPWRYLPERLGKWNLVCQRYAYWCDKGKGKGKFEHIFKIADKAYDSKALVQPAQDRAIQVITPCRARSKKPSSLDKDRYKARHLVQNLFQRIKVSRPVATRFDKLDIRFMGFVHIAGIMKWLHLDFRTAPRK